MSALSFALAQLIHTVIGLYIWIVIIAAIMSFVQPNPSNPTVRSIIVTLYRISDPLFIWVRQKMPFLVINGVDLSPIAIILALEFIDNFAMKALLG